MKKKVIRNIIIGIVVVSAIYTITIRRVKNITILVDGKVIEHRSSSRNVGQVIDEMNIELSENDKINYNIDDKINKNQEIIITRVIMQDEESLEEVDFKEVRVNDYKTKIGESRVISDGVKGETKKTYTVTYEDGKEVSRVLKSEEVIVEPIDKIIADGIFDKESLTVCVNRSSQLPSDYKPTDLVLPNVKGANSSSSLYMRKEAAGVLEELFKAAKDEGYDLYALSGYRSYSVQKSIYNPYSGYSAPPGASEHQLGLAMDVTLAKYNSKLYVEFGNTNEGVWLKENAHKYGFIIRYLEGKEDITGYNYEPWHIRYLGVELATELKEKGITLEEYYGEY